MSKKRTIETAEDRSERLKQMADRVLNKKAGDDDAIDAMVRRSIARHGA